MEEIYQKIDFSLKGQNKRDLIRYAKSKDYDYYSEFIYKNLGKILAKEIIADMIKFGIEKTPGASTIAGVKYRVRDEIEKVETTEIPPEDLCRRCKKEKKAEGNWWFCPTCQLNNNRRAEKLDNEQAIYY